MAITILPSSPLLGNETYNINNSDFEAKLLFTSTDATYHYILLRNNGEVTKVVSSGILSGYPTDVYNYRFNFDTYIKIENQNDPVFELIDQLGSVKFEGYNSCTLSLCIDTTDLLAANLTAGHLVKDSYGEVTLVDTISDIIADAKFTYKFQDRTDGLNILFESNFFGTSYIPGTIYYGSITYNNGVSTTVTKGSKDYTVVLIKTTDVDTIITSSGGEVNVTVPSRCDFNKYYFWNPNGAFDSITCTGTDNIIDNITKESIMIGNKAVYSDIKIQKQIKQNTGFGLTQNQIYGLIESPEVWKLDCESDGVYNINMMNNFMWNSYVEDLVGEEIHLAYDYQTIFAYIQLDDINRSFTIIFNCQDAGVLPPRYFAIYDNFNNIIQSFTILNGINVFSFTIDELAWDLQPITSIRIEINAGGNEGDVADVVITNTKLYNYPSLPTSDYVQSSGSNINMITNSFIDATSNVYGFESRTVQLTAGYTYTLSALGWCTLDLLYPLIGDNGYMKVVISKDAFSAQLNIKSTVDEINSVTFTAPTTGTYTIATYQDNVAHTADYYLKWYKLEVGSVNTPYIEAEYISIVNKYIIDMTRFEGYNGLSLANKNIELTFTDPKSYTRKSSKNITFFD